MKVITSYCISKICAWNVMIFHWKIKQLFNQKTWSSIEQSSLDWSNAFFFVWKKKILKSTIIMFHWRFIFFDRKIMSLQWKVMSFQWVSMKNHNFSLKGNCFQWTTMILQWKMMIFKWKHMIFHEKQNENAKLHPGGSKLRIF